MPSIIWTFILLSCELRNKINEQVKLFNINRIACLNNNNKFCHKKSIMVISKYSPTDEIDFKYIIAIFHLTEIPIEIELLPHAR